MKVLAIQFRYFGDAALMAPALRALREHDAAGTLHVLVAEEVAPLFQHLPWIDRVWGMPRRRGRATITECWPILSALRREHFDRSVDFGGNDRGAILSLLCGARERLGPRQAGGFLGRRFCYSETVMPAEGSQHEIERNLHILSAWRVPPPQSLALEIRADPALADFAAKVLPEGRIVCHLATTQPKKEWPLSSWAELYTKASAAGLRLVFSTGTGMRERLLLEQFCRMVPEAPVLAAVPELGAYLAVLKRAAAFVSCDTGPLHFAAGLGVPTVGLFGATSAAQWAPLGPRHRVVQGSACQCGGNTGVCLARTHCMGAIAPDAVLRGIQEIFTAA